MTSAAETAAPSITPTAPTSQEQQLGSGRGGQGDGRFAHHPRHQFDSSYRVRRGGRGGLRGIKSGKNIQSRQSIPNAPNDATASMSPPPGVGGGGSFGVRLTKDVKGVEGEEAVEGNSADVEAEVCFICASPVVHNSVAPCNHRTCHICALRLRALYKTKACAHCRTESEFVVFTDNPSKRYEEFSDTDFVKQEDTLGIKYEKNDIYEDTVLLLRYNCPDQDCDIACLGWPDLHRHVKSVHHKIMCDLCTRNKKVFTHEHELFTVSELRKHEKFGDDNPGAVDQSGFKGHPECGFCRQRFYGDDELYTHCRDKHERCHICDRRNQGRQQQYFVDYNSLAEHFRKDHFICLDQECLEKKFVVFESEMDLKAHQLEAHPNGLSKDARRDARRVDISAFDYRAPHQQDGRNRRDGYGRGRGRDPNVEAIPHSTAQPLRRDELAYQRQMAIQSAQSVSTRTFGGQLTSNGPSSRSNGTSTEPATITAPRQHSSSNPSFPPIDSLNLGTTPTYPTNRPPSPTSTHAVTPHERARRLRHNAVVERASNMLSNDELKISQFRDKVSAYRTSTISASQLIDTFFSLFDVPSADLGKLIKELAEIYESDTKRSDLLKAWNDWRAINEDYPTLPGPSGILPSSSASPSASNSALGSGGGRRVLKLKSSTQQSSRSAVSRHGSWGNAAAANPFPPIPPAASISVSVNRAGAGRVGATPWLTPSASSSSRPSPATSRPSSKPPLTRMANAANPDAFPALPAAPKPNTTMFGYASGAVRWNQNTAPGANPWANGTSSSSGRIQGFTGAASENESDAFAEGGGEGGGGGKKKGNKGKKQTLYKFG